MADSESPDNKKRTGRIVRLKTSDIPSGLEDADFPRVLLVAATLVARAKARKRSADILNIEQAARASAKLSKEQRKILNWIVSEMDRTSNLEEQSARWDYGVSKKQLDDLYSAVHGVRWSLSSFLGPDATNSDRSSASRSLKRLINRGLVARSQRAGFVRLTRIGELVVGK